MFTLLVLMLLLLFLLSNDMAIGCTERPQLIDTYALLSCCLIRVLQPTRSTPPYEGAVDGSGIQRG